jgi:uncharacterized RDD family membrane protein YckC
MTGPTMTGVTNCPTGGDPALTGHPCATDIVESAHSTVAAATAASDPNVDPSPDSWRVEVAASLERYRTRRKPRTPRYPSLLLPFDAPESWSRSAPLTASGSPAAAPARVAQGFVFHTKEEPAPVETPDLAESHCIEAHFVELRQSSQPAPEPSAKVIEFPRSAAIPVFHPSDLADPVFDRDRPRIVEAPEILPPPPALGGMLIEAAPQESADRRADFASVAPSASIVRRALAALVDAAVLAVSVAAFAAVFFHFNPSLYFNPSLHFDPSLNLLRLNRLNDARGPLLLLAGALGVVAVLLWAAYEFLFVVYTGSTPGLHAARLRLAAFDGSPLDRRLRRWRVLASFLSAFSAGLGYFWCVLDQNGLCWHDRITRTHVQSATAAE